MIDSSDTRFFLEDYVRILNNSLTFFAARIRKKILPLLAITLCFTAAGIAYWYSTRPYYESDLVCGYNNQIFSRKNFGEMAQKLNVLAQNGSRNELATLLNLTPDQTGKVISIEAKNRAGSLLYEDITGDYQALYFTLKATDKDVFKPFQEALVTYLSGTPYQRDIGAIQIAKIVQKIGFLEDDMRKVDSITEAYTYAIRNGYALRDSFNRPINITEILNYKDQVEERLTHMVQKKALESMPSVVVMHGFTPSDRPARGSRKIILGCTIIGLMVGLCWIILRGNKHQTNA